MERNREIRRSVASMPNPLGDGKAGERIVAILDRISKEGLEEHSPDFRDVGLPIFRLIPGFQFNGMTIYEFHERFKGIMVTLIYNEGIPKVPYPDIVIKSNHLLRILGPEKIIRMYFG